MTFERYGWVKRPGDAEFGLPLDYTEDGKGNLVTNCFSCHGGKVAGITIPGAGNTHVDLTTLATDMMRLRALDGGRDPAKVKEAIGPFNTPFSFHRGVTNAVIFAPVFTAMRDPELGRMYAKNPELLLHHDMNPPPWWNFKKKTRIYADAFAPKTPRQLMPFAMSPTFSDEKFRSFEPNFVHIYQYIEELDVPKYPYEVNSDLAEKGKALFEQTCSECHGTYGPGGEFPNRVVDIEEVGTDRRRFEAIAKDRREAGNKGWLQYFGEHPLDVESKGYLAQPLNGIWASAPYFHNGAVPTLWAVMNPSKRPRVWRRTEDGYDREKVGLEIEELSSVPEGLSSRQKRMYYDTTHVGNSAEGHTFPDALADDEKTAVIEYLKTL
jgi:mono/diheme cytochrome c family protein